MPKKTEIDQVIAHRILTGEYKPGELLKEEALAAEFNVSRTPVREVLSSLVAKGYADYERQRGVTASRIEMHTTNEILEAVEKLMPAIVPLGAARISAGQVEDLKKSLVDMREAALKEDHSNFLIAYWWWTEKIMGAVGNKYLHQTYRGVVFHLHRIRAINLKHWDGEQIAASTEDLVNFASELMKAYASHDTEESLRIASGALQRLRDEFASNNWSGAVKA